MLLHFTRIYETYGAFFFSEMTTLTSTPLDIVPQLLTSTILLVVQVVLDLLRKGVPLAPRLRPEIWRALLGSRTDVEDLYRHVAMLLVLQ